MPFEFASLLSPAATNTAKPFSGYPPYHFVGGNIDEPTVPVDALADAVGKVIREKGHAMAKYGMDSGPQGDLSLREFICDCLKRRNSMTVKPQEVLLTAGSLQAMDLVNKALLSKGDVVLLEAANYSGALSRLDALGVEYVGIELDHHGMRMDALERALSDLAAAGRKPKYIYTVPTVQNPTGTVMPVERRREMLALAKQYNVPIFEDDCYADLVFSGERPPAIHALDDDCRVIYCGTFSKTIAPALRVGYLVAPWPLMGHILPLKTDAGSGALEQMVLADYLPGNFDAHVAGLLPVLQAKADALCSRSTSTSGPASSMRRRSAASICGSPCLKTSTPMCCIQPHLNAVWRSTPVPSGRSMARPTDTACGFASAIRQSTPSAAASPNWQTSALSNSAFRSEAEMSVGVNICPARTCSKLGQTMFSVAESAMIDLKTRQGLRAIK